MKKKLIDPKIDFADSDFESFNFDGENLTIYLTSWDNKNLKIIFYSTLHFIYSTSDLMSNVYEIVDSNKYDQFLNNVYKNLVVEKHRIFILEDIYDYPFIEVLAKDVEIIKE